MASPTTAIIRVKRRIEENPLDTLLLNCKRVKYNDDIVDDTTSTNTDDTNSIKTDSTLFKFVGTLDKAENPLKYFKENHQINIKQLHNDDDKLNKLIDKIKNDQKDLSKQNRLKIINCHRALSDDSEINDKSSINTVDDNLSTLIVDVESELPIDPNKEQNNNEYVYDIYYSTCNQEFNDFSLDLLHSIEPLNDTILFDEKYRNHDDDDDEFMSDDSNDENNWRNDYPDDEEFDNMLNNDNNQNDDDDDVEFLNNIMKTKFQLNNDLCELSSTDDDDDDDIDYYDNDDALKYGKCYAKFKARENDYNDIIDDDDDIYGSDRDYYYNDDDDDNDK